MSENLIIGCVTILICLTIQCGIVGVLFHFLLVLEKKQLIKTTPTAVPPLLVAVMLVMLAGNLAQMFVWACLFYAFGEFADFAAAFYHSVVNFTTLGYGDLVMSQQRRLLGALEAANGVLMFGLTTGFLFALLWELLQREWDIRVGQ
jgi:hypothetical protein